MNKNYSTIVSMSSDRNIVGIQNVYMELIHDRMKLDKFFSMYLDKFDRKMDPENGDTPIWQLYKKKLKEYSELQQAIKIAEYYMKKSYA